MADRTYDHLTPEDLATIRRRLGSVGLFTAHAHTDVTRLLAEVCRLRLALAVERQAHAEAQAELHANQADRAQQRGTAT
jgi:hypothetical protein